MPLSGAVPSPRTQHSCTLVNDTHIVVIGGGTGGIASKMFEVRRPAVSAVFVAVPGPFQTMRADVDAVHGPQTYACCFLLQYRASQLSVTNEVFVLDTRSWRFSRPTVAGAPPAPRMGHFAAPVFAGSA